jgi:hypothetical protein
MKLLLAISFLIAVSAWAAEPSFSNMEEGDSVEMTFRSTGCFHNITGYYEVRKSNGSSFFTEYAITWDKKIPGVMTEKKVIGVGQLAQHDIEGLDGLLRYYRGKKEGGSTTQASLLVEYFEGGKRIKVESLEDGSGGPGLEGKKDIASFFELTQRFHK